MYNRGDLFDGGPSGITEVVVPLHEGYESLDMLG